MMAWANWIRGRHQVRGVGAGVAEHHPLVAGALSLFSRPVHALGDVGGLGMHGVEDLTGAEIDAEARLRLPLEVGMRHDTMRHDDELCQNARRSLPSDERAYL